MVINPGSLLGVPGVQTSYTFAVLDLPDLSVQIHEVRTGEKSAAIRSTWTDGDGFFILDPVRPTQFFCLL